MSAEALNTEICTNCKRRINNKRNRSIQECRESGDWECKAVAFARQQGELTVAEATNPIEPNTKESQLIDREMTGLRNTTIELENVGHHEARTRIVRYLVARFNIKL